MMQYSTTSEKGSKAGREWYLYSTATKDKAGNDLIFYFFSPHEGKTESGSGRPIFPVATMPDGFTYSETKNGFVYTKKA